jgi:acetone carboxylase gamma subunit
MRKRISETLFTEARRICCASCAREIAPAGKSWKASASLSTVPVKDLPGSGGNVDPRLLLRRFSCPQCGRLLDTEIALPEDPFLDDVVVAPN